MLRTKAIARDGDEASNMEDAIRRLLAYQNPNQKHTALTRITISLIIIFANSVLYGFYGVMGSVVFYLLGVELAGIGLGWMFLPLVVMLAYGLYKSFLMIMDYWRHYGHG
ncbi:MAG: hypothetical protein AAF387_11870 [Pseudomonadota bacterium]